MPSQRYLAPYIREDLEEKMVFVSGPRQVGKTTLALKILKGDEGHPAYFNWDNEMDRKKLLSFEFPREEKLYVFDEIHKYKRWRNWLKGIYDKTRSHHQYLITGSARLDLFSRGGDALTGRYHLYRLHPLSLSEVDPDCGRDATDALLQYGGFPEPFFSQSLRKRKRWQKERQHQVLREDIRDLTRVEDITQISILAGHLPNLIGSPLSINAIREDLQINHKTASNWLHILENLFVFFQILPFGSPRIRAVKKETKPYLWDWTLIEEPGHRFENMVACHLLKYCHLMEDSQGDTMELRYIRDADKREVDFVVLKNNNPLFAVECKIGDRAVHPAIAYFSERTKIPIFYQVHLGTKDYQHAKLPLRVLPFHRFVQECHLP